MRPDEAAELARKRPVPWDDLRAARVQRRVLAGLRARPESPRDRRLSRPLAWALAAAALLAALVLIGTRFERGAPPVRLDLADGSFVVHDATARVVPDVITPERIELRQSMGSASYDVAKKPGRTFVVRIEDVRVEVLGTAFRVEQIGAAIRVIVQRGHVQVSRGSRTVSLVAGEEVTLSDSDPAGRAEPAATTPATPDPASAPPTGPAEAAPEVAPTATAAAAEPAPTGTAAEEPGPAELFRRADSARAAGNTAEALRLLNQLVQRHPRDGRRTLAIFTIGRLQAQTGNHARAAAAFESLGSAFGGEALAEAALAHAAAGQSARARALAAQYATQFPDGPRTRELARLVE